MMQLFSKVGRISPFYVGIALVSVLIVLVSISLMGRAPESSLSASRKIPAASQETGEISIEQVEVPEVFRATEIAQLSRPLPDFELSPMPEEEVPSLLLDRDVPARDSLGISGQLEELLAEAHPTLPQKTISKIALIAAESLESSIQIKLDKDGLQRLQQNIVAGRAEIENLPFTKSDEHLAYSTDYLASTYQLWGSTFTTFEQWRASGDFEPQGSSQVVQESLSVYEGALQSLYGAYYESEGIKTYRRHTRNMDSAGEFFFSPELKFPLTDDQRQVLASDLSEAVEKAREEISDTMKRFEPPSGYPPQSREFIEEKRAKAYGMAASRFFPVTLRAYKKAVPKTFWEDTASRLAPNYSEMQAALTSQWHALNDRERKLEEARVQRSIQEDKLQDVLTRDQEVITAVSIRGLLDAD